MKLIRRRKLRENQYPGAVAELSDEKQAVLNTLATELNGIKNKGVKNLLGDYFSTEILFQDPDNEGNIPAPTALEFTLRGTGRKGTGQDQTDILREIEKILFKAGYPDYKEVPPELFTGIALPTGENFEEFGLSLITIAKTMEDELDDRFINYMTHRHRQERILKEMIKREIKKLLRR